MVGWRGFLMLWGVWAACLVAAAVALVGGGVALRSCDECRLPDIPLSGQAKQVPTLSPCAAGEYGR